MTAAEWSWLIGLVEGEGCFAMKRTGRLAIRVQMTDLDPLEKVLSTTGAGNLTGPYKPKNPAHKPTWAWTVSKHADSVALASVMYPHLSRRRQSQIKAILGTYRTWSTEETAEMSPLHWTAGLLEGEAYFGYSSCLTIEVVSIDKLNIVQLKALHGGGTRRIAPRRVHWSESWSWSVHGQRAIEMMLEVLPYMGERQSQRVSEILTKYNTRPRRGDSRGGAKFGSTDTIRAAVESSTTCKEVFAKLGAPLTGSSYTMLYRCCAELRISPPPSAIKKR
jgi:hypothetical protein